MDEIRITRKTLELSISGASLMEIKVWKDSRGYAFECEDSKFELTEAGFDQLLSELKDLQEEELYEDEGIMRHLIIDAEEDE